MHEDITILIESLRRGQYEDPGEKISLLAAALHEHQADDALILSLLQAPQAPLRLAGLEACRDREVTGLIAALHALATDSEEQVRQRLADLLAVLPEELFDETLRVLLRDDADAVRSSAVKKAVTRPDFREEVRAMLLDDSEWEVRETTARVIAETHDPDFIPDLFSALARDDDTDVQRQCARALERWLSRDHADTVQRLPTDATLLTKAREALGNIYGRYNKLNEWLQQQTATSINYKELEKFGVDLTLLAQAGTLPHAYGFEDYCDSLVKMITRDSPRSIVLLGKSGCGKSALVNELVYELAKPENGEWHVLRVSPSDFMAGTLYVGEWETKVRELVQTVRRPRHVLVYVPNLSDLSAAGRWSKSDSNVASALAPYVEEGSILLLGESTPKEFERGLGGEQPLRRLFEKVLVAEADRERTLQVLRAMRDAAGVQMEESVIEQLSELSDQLLGHSARPGNAAVLMQAVIDVSKETKKPITPRDVLRSLSHSTGIPVDLLDDHLPLDVSEIRSFFERRIIGQPEAVDAVVDIITLIKAGLTDPNKPFGVFLFIGPTGVGKTELARTLAEYLFGDPARLLRYDMSEYASFEGFERLIGSAQQNGQLTDAVRQHPFSVVLLDEIEKSHVNVFDLCLQIFDAGRLTDGRGATVDFRRTIVILTSNIGATMPTSRLGFDVDDELAGVETSQARTMRDLSQVFRPEFLNRIDRIVNFRPLSREDAGQIAQREVNLVLQRSGITRRRLAVDIDPAVVSLLVKEGYSPHFGARPLKRTVERMLLLPLARVIAKGSIPEQAILRLTQREGKIEVLISRSSAPATREANAPLPPAPLLETLQALFGRMETLAPALGALAERKSALLEKTHDPAFYQDSRLRVQTFDEIRRLDQFTGLADGIRTRLERLHHRMVSSPVRKTDEPPLRQRLGQLERQLAQVHFIANRASADDLCDVLLCISRIDMQGEPLTGVRQLTELYLGLAGRWEMQAEVLAEYVDDNADRVYLQVSGLGAFALFQQEAGLHRFVRRYRVHAPRTGREVQREDREVNRVDCLPISGEPEQQFASQMKVKVQALKPAWSRFLSKADMHLRLFHEPSLYAFEAWTNGPRNDALERLQRILFLQLRAIEDNRGLMPAEIVRYYNLGIAPEVRDVRSDRSTTRIKEVLKGNLDPFMWAE